ncbi:hypothetical protein M419DRAFT_74517 [Trichoderma reesei RUT C-30]|uniref:DUF7580 domain-containing protein n=1 Tax=Hypocrea jecorina (strain ATCC 56765 / BCRC 32924 / NRRL 11460 / Rut C-30) TaxID=1344414 RepID=A0A024SEA6_HYPJR|nr:hypothetical protein M419DRAFT_74517 [Trichoderma reesei RUT C-30]
MAEAVGIALSVLPIVIWALEKYSEPLDAYSDYHRAIGTLQANLQIQRMHLEATLQSIGLRHPTPRELADCLRQRFPSHHREIAFIVRQMDEMMIGMMDGLQVDMSRKPLWTTHDSPDRISWEWRRVKRSFRTKKCDKMIRDLRSWNDDLRHLVQSAAAAEPRPPDESHAIQRVRRLYNRGNCESVRRTLRSLHRALQAGLLGDGDACHQVCIELNSLHAGGFPLLTFRIGVLHGADGVESSAAWKLFYAAGEAAQGSSVSDSQPYPFPSRPSTLRSRRSVEDTSITSIPPLPQKPLIPCPPPPITNLCNALSSPSHTEELFGSLKDPTPSSTSSSSSSSSHEGTFFSLSHLSRNHDAIIREISLEKIIATESQRVAPAIQPLSAKRRYGIAASLAWAVLYLADSPWLSQGLNRHKVKLFLQRKQANGFISLSEKAYLASSLSKPTTTTLPSPASSSASLRHITATTRRTPKSLIFDLGILLIELAVNQSFSRDSLSAILQHDYRPLKNYLDRVEQEAGIYYFNAAQRCVYGVFLADQGQMDFDLDMFQHEFYSTVVAPLQATYEGR